MKKVSILIVLVLGCFIESKAQKVALKSNLLYDATTTMNLGLEFGLARKWTLDVPVNYNPWKPDNGRRLRHWGIQPEVRYWFCERFRRTFIGVHGHYADFNVGGFPDWSFISENMQNSRYQGYLYEQPWPEYEEAKTVENTIEIPVQINGKTKTVIQIPLDITKEDAIAMGKEALGNKLNGTIVKEIYVPKKIVNIVQK